MKPFEVEFQGERVKVWAEKRAGVLWFHVKGETKTYEPIRRKGSSGGNQTEKPGQVSAPMPGKILKVLCKKGENVEAGRTLIVMEAMKMEYTLTADQAGPVKEVNCQVGDQVRLGQVLVALAVGE